MYTINYQSYQIVKTLLKCNFKKIFIPYLYLINFFSHTNTYISSIFYKIWHKNFHVFKKYTLALWTISPAIINFTKIYIFTMFLQLPLLQLEYAPFVERFQTVFKDIFINIFVAFTLNYAALIYKLCYYFLIRGNPKKLRKRWKKLIYFIGNSWEILKEFSKITNFVLYISGNISGRPGKRRKLTRYIVDKTSFKYLHKYANTQQFHTPLPTNLINIGFKSIE